MDYVFGNDGTREILKTKGDVHTDLSGFQAVVMEYPDQTITDQFHIVRKYNSKEDVEGNCYDWYEIDKHYRTADKTPPIKEELTKQEASIYQVEDAVCELDEGTGARLDSIENALCELDELLNK